MHYFLRLLFVILICLTVGCSNSATNQTEQPNIDETKLTENEKYLLTLVGGDSTIATINHVPNDLKSVTMYAEHYREGKLVETIDTMTLNFNNDYPAPNEVKLAYLNIDLEKQSYLKFGFIEKNGVTSAGSHLISNDNQDMMGFNGMAEMPQEVKYGEPMLIGYSVHNKRNSLKVEDSITNDTKDRLLKYDNTVFYYVKLNK